MTSTAENDPTTAADIRALRLTGELGEALRVATAAMGNQPSSPDLMGEAIRTLILCDQAATALRLYQVFAGPEMGNQQLEQGALVRLALQLGRTDLLAEMPVPPEPAWLAMLLTDGEDPAVPLVLHDMQLRAAEGPSTYVFAGGCPYCGHPASVQLRTNLLVQLTHLCVSCFGRYRVDYLSLREFLQAHCRDYLTMDVAAAERDLIDHVRPRLMEPDGAPDLVRALGQDYHFLLNEILARYLLADPTLGAEVVS